MFRSFGFSEFLLLLDGLRWTVALTAVAFAGGGLVGLLLLVLRVAPARPLRWLAIGWIQAVQGTPLLGLLFVIFFGLPLLLGFDVSRWIAAAVALAVYGGAFLAEIWRGAVEAIPKGQWEASAALGLPRLRQFRLIILPQALAIAIPPTVGFLVQLIKNTSLASIIGMIELSRRAQMINSTSFEPFLVFGLTALLYFCVCFPLTRFSRRLERRLAEAR
jgi:polar amino acid transport system permease protein